MSGDIKQLPNKKELKVLVEKYFPTENMSMIMGYGIIFVVNIYILGSGVFS